MEQKNTLNYLLQNFNDLKNNDPKKLSKLLSQYGNELLNKGYRKNFVKVWMEEALSLDSHNEEARLFISDYNWYAKQNLLDELNFPPIRETDSRTTKNAKVTQFKQICDQFLEHADEELEKLQDEFQFLQRINSETAKSYEILVELYEKITQTIVEFLSVLDEYEESSGGSFYSTSSFAKIKEKMADINDLRNEWKLTFEDNEGSEKNQKTALDELQEMIGLEEVKTRIEKFYAYLKYQKNRKEAGFQTRDELSMNMVILGNPGTGKTTLARTLAKIYHELGVLPREEVIETNRSQLIGSFVGQTEENVRMIVEKAIGGVLFIDEAYSLKREGQSGNDYGQTAIDTLVSLMTSKEYGGKFSVILAGYPEEMRQFLSANPGLRSRFPQANIIELPDYSLEELLKIADKIAKDNDFIITDAGKRELAYRIEQEQVDVSFGNARSVQDIILQAIFQKGASLTKEDNLFSYTVLDKEDFTKEQVVVAERKTPMEQLNELVGLKEIKEAVQTYISFVKMQKYRRDHNYPSVPIQLHSVFTGNPGTGKTTVAKIYAELLKEVGILKRGHLVVTGRADLIAGYVGQSALKTRKKIREALGGVLFIDEAYSLFRGNNNDFGKEVVDTIVEEMTKHKENLVIVLAGYPNEMNQLLESNPGLKSRFKKFFHFPDYSPEEIIAIMQRYAEKYDYTIENDALAFLLEEMKTNPPNGNGRFAENMIHESIQQQSLRLMKDAESFEIDHVNIITKEDIKEALATLKKGE